MNNLTMLPIELLEHHPDNPRKDLGDLKELTASIRESGVMQNLTVVPRGDGVEGYWVVIGNRRLEASRAAGLKQLPCLISDMDYKTQLATMMAENMQRVDLTLLEQAQGVQMMMDLGMEVGEIARKTGLRKDAINRRAQMLKYDSAKVKQAIAKGGTLSDFAELDKIRDDAMREKLLGDIGTPNFRNHLKGALEDQRDWEVVGRIIEKLEVFANRIDKHGEVNGRKQDMLLVKTWHRPNEKLAEEFAMPKDVKERRYYYTVEKYPNVTLYVAVDKQEDVNAIEEEKKSRKERLRELCDAKMQMVKRMTNRHRELRIDFLKNSPNLKLDRDYLVARLLDVCLQWGGYNNQRQKALLCDLLQVADVGKWGDEWWRDLLRTRTAYAAACIMLVKMDDEYQYFWASEWDGDAGTNRPTHCRNRPIAQLYDILQHIGYEMCDEEKALMDGTHPVFERPEVE